MMPKRVTLSVLGLAVVALGAVAGVLAAAASSTHSRIDELKASTESWTREMDSIGAKLDQNFARLNEAQQSLDQALQELKRTSNERQLAAERLALELQTKPAVVASPPAKPTKKVAFKPLMDPWPTR